MKTRTHQIPYITGRFDARENVALFISWAKHAYKIHQVVIFEVNDLVEKKNVRNVLNRFDCTRIPSINPSLSLLLTVPVPVLCSLLKMSRIEVHFHKDAEQYKPRLMLQVSFIHACSSHTYVVRLSRVYVASLDIV